MEGVVILLGEFVAIAATACIVVLVEGVGLLVSLLARAVFLVLGRRRAAARPTAPTPIDSPPAPPAPNAAETMPAPTRSTRVAQWIGLGFLGLAVLSLLATLVVDLFFFDSLVRSVLARVERNTSITIAAGSVEGSVWSGRVQLGQAKIRRQGHATSDFDITMAELTIDLSVTDLIFTRAVMEELRATDVRGTFTRTGVADRLKPRRPFRVRRLEVRDARLDVTDRTRRRAVTAAFEIDSLVAEPFRSNWAWFDVLFRSNAEGRIDGRRLTIATRQIEGGRETQWRGTAVPVAIVAPYLPRPFAWINAGTLDVAVDDRWSLGDDPEIVMDWRLDFRELSVEVPEDLPRTKRLLARGAASFLRRRAKHLPLHFKVKLDRNGFKGRASFESAGLLETVGKALGKALARRLKAKG